MDPLSRLGKTSNKIADAIGEIDPIGGAVLKAANPLNLFGGDSMNRTGGTASMPGAPPMPGGGDIDELLSKLNQGKKNAFDVSNVANTSTSMGKGGVSASDGPSESPAGGGAGGGDPMGGMGNMLQGIMGIVGKILPLVMSFF
jgi:hypothetical protein